MDKVLNLISSAFTILTIAGIGIAFVWLHVHQRRNQGWLLDSLQRTPRPRMDHLGDYSLNADHDDEAIDGPVANDVHPFSDEHLDHENGLGNSNDTDVEMAYRQSGNIFNPMTAYNVVDDQFHVYTPSVEQQLDSSNHQE